MRIRQVRPEFWRDPLMADLPADVRLFYIGLWCVADDDGWLPWDVAQIGAELYPYVSRARRERDIAQWGAKLISTGRVVIEEGCRCAYIPTLALHQKVGGKRSTPHGDAHKGHVQTVPGRSGKSRTDPDFPGPARANNATVTNPTPTIPAREGLPHIDDETAALAAELTGKHVLTFGVSAQNTLDDLCERHKPKFLHAALREIAAKYDREQKRKPSPPELIFGTRNYLEPILPSKAVRPEGGTSEDRERAAQVRQERIRAQRVRNYHNTGVWDPAWGPAPRQSA